MIIEFALFLLTLIIQQQDKPKTAWEKWASEVNARLNDADQKSLQEHQRLRNEVSVLRETVRALELRQGGGSSSPPTVVIDPAAALSNLPPVPAKTADGKDVADADSVKEVLDAVKEYDWETGAIVVVMMLGNLVRAELRSRGVKKKVEEKLEEAIALPSPPPAPGNNAAGSEIPKP